MKLLKDPLLHFLVLGFGLFALYAFISPDAVPDDNPKRITVTREALLTLVQYRTKTFQPQLAASRLDNMSKAQLKRLIDEYVREEALSREAKALGLGREDYVIKRRMIQKVEFITQGFADAAIKVSDDDLKIYYDKHRDKYREPGNITFTHVYFKSDGRGMNAAVALAKAELQRLQAQSAVFSDAPKFGERFPYGVNFVERTREHVASQFGQDMTAKIFELSPDDNRWQGPFASSYGAHVVMIIKKTDARTPSFDSVKDRVESDVVRERRKALSDKAVQAIVEGYKIDLQLTGKDGKRITLDGLEG